MKDYKIISKRDYKHSQNNEYINLIKYIVIQKDLKKYIIFNFKNNLNQSLKSYSFDIVQKDIYGAYIATNNFSEDNLLIEKKTEFLTKKLFEIDNKCEDIEIELKNAVFDKIIYDNGSTYNIASSSDNHIDNGIKQKKIKKFPLKFAILPSLLMLVTLSSVFCFVDYYRKHNYEFKIEDFEYSFLDNDTSLDSDIIITKYNGETSNVLIPEKIKNHNIIKVGDSAFENNNHIANIKFENSIEIGDFAFSGCKKLNSVELHDNSIIGDKSFYDCFNLEEINFNMVTSIGDSSFYNCQNLKELSSNKISSIGSNAFEYSGLKKVNLYNDEKVDLGPLVFKNCLSLKDVTLNLEVNSSEESSSILNNCSRIEKLKLLNYNNVFGSKKYKDIVGNDDISLQFFESENMDRIEPFMFEECHNLKSIDVKNCLETNIGQYAFYNCKSLKNVELGKHINTIDSYAFYNTSIEKLETDELSMISDYAFYNVDTLKNIEFDHDVKIGDSAFMDCNNLIDLKFNEKAFIGNNAFKNCNSLKELKSKNITDIGAHSFSNSSIKKLELISDEPMNINDGAFENCESLTHIKLDTLLANEYKNVFNGVKNIENMYVKDYDNFFKDLTFNEIIKSKDNKLTYFETDNLEKVKDEMFDNNKNLKSVIIKNLKSDVIGEKAFNNCISLEKLETNIDFVEINPYAFFNTNISDIKINNLEKIGDFAFTNNNKINDLNFKKDVIIGKNAFENCQNIKTLSFANKSYVDDNAFKNCVSLNSLNLKNINKIGSSAFENCGLEKLSIFSDELLELGEKAFNNCKNLTDINFDFLISDENKNYNFINGCENIERLYVKNYSNIFKDNIYNTIIGSNENNLKKFETSYMKNIADNLFIDSQNLTSVIIRVSDSIDIGSYAFSNCKNLNTIILDSNIENINKYALYNTNIENFNGYNIKRIDEYAFSNCEKLQSIELTDYCENIGIGAFLNCSLLEEIYLSNKISVINDSIFENCENLLSVYFKDDILLTSIGKNSFKNCGLLNELNFPTTFAEIGTGAFDGCSSLKSFKFGDNIKVIPERAFAECNNLINIELSNGIEKISKDSFAGCKKLINLNLPEGLTIIEDNAFERCTSLSYIVIPDSITSIGKNIFEGCLKLENLTIPFVEENDFGQSTFEYIFGQTDIPLKEIVISKQERIPSNFINNMEKLESIEFLNAVNVESCIINNCKNLTTVIFNNDIDTFAYPIFDNCLQIESLTIPYLGNNKNDNKNVYEIFGYYYNSNNFLKTLNISFINNINSSTFDSLEGLETLYLDHIENATRDCFSYLYSLKKITINSGLLTLPEYAFGWDKNLEEVNLNNDLLKIEEWAFYECSKLRILKLPKNITYIGSNCFRDCNMLEKIIMPKSLSGVGMDLFYDCNALYEIVNYSTVDLYENNYYLSECILSYISDERNSIPTFEFNGFKFALKNGKWYLVNISNLNDLKNVKLPDKVLKNGKEINYTIKSQLFRNSSINDIIIPSNVVCIDKNAFYNSNLKNIIFNENSSLKEIGSHAFHNSNIEKLELPEGIEILNSYSLSEMNKLYSLTIPSTINTIEDNVVYQSKSLLEIFNLSNLDIKPESEEFGGIAKNSLLVHKSLDEEPLKKIYYNDFIFYVSKDLRVLGSYENNNSIQSLHLPEKIIDGDIIYDDYRIGNGFISTFERWSLREIYIPKAVTVIGDSAFNNAYNLTKVEIENGSKLVEIKNNAFNYCEKLSKINLPNSLEKIGNSAFYHCISLNSILLGENLSEIASDAFYDCFTLIEIYNYSKIDLSNKELYENITKYSKKIITDKNSKGFDFYDIDGVVYYVNEDNELVLLRFNNDNLYKYVTPKEIQFGDKKFNKYHIDNYAFYNSNLENIIITKEVVSLGQYSFYNSYNLKELNFEKDSIITIIPSYCFQQCNNLLKINLPENLNIIDEYSFSQCNKLASIELPKNLKEINHNAFENCDSLIAIVNYSDLKIEKGKTTFGGVANKCVILFDKPSEKINLTIEKISDNNRNYNVMIVNDELYYLNNEGYQSNEIFAFPASIKIGEKTFNSYKIAGNNLQYSSIQVIIIPKAVTGILSGSFKDAYNLKTVLYEGTKEEWDKIIIKDLNILSQEVKYYSKCVHNEESWTYLEDGTCLYNINYNNIKYIKEPTCQDYGEIEFDCNICKKHVSAKVKPIKHIPGTICKHCNKKVSADNYIYNLFDGNFNLYNTNNAYKIRNYENQNNVELNSRYDKIGTYEFDFIIYPENEKDELKFYLNDKLIKTYTTKDGFVHYSIDLKQNDKFKMVYEIVDNNMSSKDLFYMKNLMFLS